MLGSQNSLHQAPVVLEDTPGRPQATGPWQGLKATAAPTMLMGLIAFGVILLRPGLPIDETRYLEVLREHLGGNALVLHLMGEPYAEKPPLLFWLARLLVGIGIPLDTALRSIPALSATLTIPLVARIGRRAGIELAGWMQATLCLPFLVGQLLFFDSLLALGVWAALDAWTRGRDRWAGRVVGDIAHSRFRAFYLPVALVGALPGTLLLFRGGSSSEPWTGRTVRVLLGLLLVFTLIKSKQAHYLVPAAPAVALLATLMISTGIVTLSLHRLAGFVLFPADLERSLTADRTQPVALFGSARHGLYWFLSGRDRIERLADVDQLERWIRENPNGLAIVDQERLEKFAPRPLPRAYRS